jgi:glycerol-3-phosphate dehydrogenase
MTDATPTDPVADVLVIGAGINGAAVAREAALNGLAVTLVEADDLAAGTSAASSRLIHGGIRYLENGEVRLVRQSLAERERLLATAPHLVRPYPLLVPVYEGGHRGRGLVRAGMVAYDVLSPDKSTPRHRMLTAAETRRRYPGLAATGLRGAALYHDAIAVSCERLVVEQVLDAVALGATVHTHTRVCGLDRGPDGVLAVACVGPDGTADVEHARTVVNCAGPWVDEVLATAAAPRPRLIGGTKGSHLVVPAFPGAPETGVHFEADDGRPVLVLPQPDGTVLIGSTDLFVEGAATDGIVTADEVDYLLAQVDRLVPQACLRPDDVLSSYCGVRPLPYTPDADAAAVSRDHHVVPDPALPGLFSVVGGKLTTHRALGEQAVRVVRRALHLPGRASRASRRLPLPGGRCADWPAFRARVRARPGWPVDVLDRLLDHYGVRAPRVLDVAGRDRDLAGRIAGTPVLAAEVAVALREELATTLVDVVARRLLLGRLPDRGLGAATEVAAVASDIAGWSPARTRDELEGYREWARRLLPEPPHRALAHHAHPRSS